MTRPPQLKGERPIKVRHGTDIHDATIRWWAYTDQRSTVEVEGPFGSVKASGRGALEALETVRTSLEPLDWFLGIQGSLPGRWASGMLGDMLGGEKVHVHSPEGGGRKEVVGTFDDADPAEAVTVEEQRRWQRVWGRRFFGGVRSRTPPPITDALRAEARRRPGGWVYAVDPAFDPAGAVPPHGIVGAWKVDARGDIGDEYEPNSNYRPSPQALELPPPTDPLDAAVQLAATGYGPDSAVADTLLGGEVLVLDDERGPTVQVFSSHEHLPARPESAFRRRRGRDVVEALPPGGELQINPGGPLTVRVSGDDLRGRLTR